MKTIIRLSCVIALVFNSACSQQGGKTANGAVGSDTVIVNRVTEFQNLDTGEIHALGEAGVMHNAAGLTVEQMDEKVLNGEVEMGLSEQQLADLGVLLVEDKENSQAATEENWAWLGFFLVAGVSFWLGWFAKPQPATTVVVGGAPAVPVDTCVSCAPAAAPAACGTNCATTATQTSYWQ